MREHKKCLAPLRPLNPNNQWKGKKKKKEKNKEKKGKEKKREEKASLYQTVKCEGRAGDGLARSCPVPPGRPVPVAGQHPAGTAEPASGHRALCSRGSPETQLPGGWDVAAV